MRQSPAIARAYLDPPPRAGWSKQLVLGRSANVIFLNPPQYVANAYGKHAFSSACKAYVIRPHADEQQQQQQQPIKDKKHLG